MVSAFERFKENISSLLREVVKWLLRPLRTCLPANADPGYGHPGSRIGADRAGAGAGEEEEVG